MNFRRQKSFIQSINLLTMLTQKKHTELMEKFAGYPVSGTNQVSLNVQKANQVIYKTRQEFIKEILLKASPSDREGRFAAVSTVLVALEAGDLIDMAIEGSILKIDASDGILTRNRSVYDQILNTIWGHETAIFENSIEVNLLKMK